MREKLELICNKFLQGFVSHDSSLVSNFLSFLIQEIEMRNGEVNQFLKIKSIQLLQIEYSTLSPSVVSFFLQLISLSLKVVSDSKTKIELESFLQMFIKQVEDENPIVLDGWLKAFRETSLCFPIHSEILKKIVDLVFHSSYFVSNLSLSLISNHINQFFTFRFNGETNTNAKDDNFMATNNNYHLKYEQFLIKSILNKFFEKMKMVERSSHYINSSLSLLSLLYENPFHMNTNNFILKSENNNANQCVLETIVNHDNLYSSRFDYVLSKNNEYNFHICNFHKEEIKQVLVQLFLKKDLNDHEILKRVLILLEKLIERNNIEKGRSVGDDSKMEDQGRSLIEEIFKKLNDDKEDNREKIIVLMFWLKSNKKWINHHENIGKHLLLYFISFLPHKKNLQIFVTPPPLPFDLSTFPSLPFQHQSLSLFFILLTENFNLMKPELQQIFESSFLLISQSLHCNSTNNFLVNKPLEAELNFMVDVLIKKFVEASKSQVEEIQLLIIHFKGNQRILRKGFEVLKLLLLNLSPSPPFISSIFSFVDTINRNNFKIFDLFLNNNEKSYNNNSNCINNDEIIECVLSFLKEVHLLKNKFLCKMMQNNKNLSYQNNTNSNNNINSDKNCLNILTFNSTKSENPSVRCSAVEVLNSLIECGCFQGHISPHNQEEWLERSLEMAMDDEAFVRRSSINFLSSYFSLILSSSFSTSTSSTSLPTPFLISLSPPNFFSCSSSSSSFSLIKYPHLFSLSLKMKENKKIIKLMRLFIERLKMDLDWEIKITILNFIQNNINIFFEWVLHCFHGNLNEDLNANKELVVVMEALLEATIKGSLDYEGMVRLKTIKVLENLFDLFKESNVNLTTSISLSFSDFINKLIIASKINLSKNESETFFQDLPFFSYPCALAKLEEVVDDLLISMVFHSNLKNEYTSEEDEENFQMVDCY